MRNKNSIPNNSPEKPDGRPEQGNTSSSASPLQRFEASMNIGFEEWHDGIGYDIEAIRTASQAERCTIEKMLINHSPRDWRDIEALAQINSESARKTIRDAVKDLDPVVRVAVSRFAPDLVTDEERRQSIIDALQNAEIFSGLSPVLDEVEKYHPEEIKEALIKGLLNRKGNVAVLFAAMLFYILGEAKKPFNMKQRSFFLRFNTEDTKQRANVFREFCQKLKINPEKYLIQQKKSFKM